MSDTALPGLIECLQRALATAESSLHEYADLQGQAVAAHEKSCELEWAHRQTAEELQACQEHCQDLQQQLAIANEKAVSLQSALAARKQQAASAHEQASQAQQQLQTLQEQLRTMQQPQHKQLQEHVQQLQADLAAAHSSRDLLQQQLQQQDAQLQELLRSADATKSAGDDSDEELPTTQFEDGQSVSLQQQRQQQEEIQALRVQVGSLLDDNAVLQVRNESLTQQLSVYKLELARLQEQPAAAVLRPQQMQTTPQQPKQQQQHDEPQQSGAQQPSHQGKMLHDKAYYKRKYIEIKERYDILKQQRQNGSVKCQAAEAKPSQQLHNSGRLAGTEQQRDTAAEAPGAAQKPSHLTGSSPRLKHSSRQLKQQHTGIDGVASAVPAAASPTAVTKPSGAPDSDLVLVDLTVTPSKRPNKRAATAVDQPSPSMAAAAARLAAALTPRSKRRKASKVPDTAATAGALQIVAAGAAGVAAFANMPQASAVQCQTSIEATAAAAAVVISSAKDINEAAQTAQHMLQAQQQQQQQDNEQCEVTLPAATNSNSTGDTVRLSQHQQQQQQPTMIKQGSGAPACNPAGVPTALLKHHVANAVAEAVLDGSTAEFAAANARMAKHAVLQERELPIAEPQDDCRQPQQQPQQQQQQQQQHSTGSRSPAWRAARGIKGKNTVASDAIVTVANGLNNSSTRRKGSRSRSPQDICISGEPAAAAAGVDTSAAAGSDSDFECPALPRRQQPQQQGHVMQPKAARKRAKSPCDLEEFDLSQEQQQQQHQSALQDQQQPHAAAAAAVRHHGRTRGVTPAPQLQRCEQQQKQQQEADNELPVAAGCPANQQVEFAVPQPQHQKQSAAQRSRSLPNAPAGTASGRSRYTMVCSKPVAAKQHSAPAAMGPPAEQPGAPVSSGMADGAAGIAAAGNRLESVGSIENKPPVSAGPGPAGDYKYQEVVRKKAARELLTAYECEECKKFYSALHSWGAAGGLGLPTCGHAAPNQTAAAGGGGVSVAAAAGGAGAVEGVDTGQQQLGVHQLVQNAGRHRAKWQPPSTPPGFWHIGFTPDVDSPVAARR